MNTWITCSVYNVESLNLYNDYFCVVSISSRLASVGILGKEWEPGVDKLGWHGNFDTGFERNILFKIPCAGFLNFLERKAFTSLLYSQ